MSDLFGTRYFEFIASSYAITALVLVVMVVWVLLTQRSRRRQIAALEEAGIRRASREKAKSS
ncbi:MAG: heme exporter protein CcmD [Pseudomonadota bacterium]